MNIWDNAVFPWRFLAISLNASQAVNNLIISSDHVCSLFSIAVTAVQHTVVLFRKFVFVSVFAI